MHTQRMKLLQLFFLFVFIIVGLFHSYINLVYLLPSIPRFYKKYLYSFVLFLVKRSSDIQQYSNRKVNCCTIEMNVYLEFWFGDVTQQTYIPMYIIQYFPFCVDICVYLNVYLLLLWMHMMICVRWLRQSRVGNTTLKFVVSFSRLFLSFYFLLFHSHLYYLVLVFSVTAHCCVCIANKRQTTLVMYIAFLMAQWRAIYLNIHICICELTKKKGITFLHDNNTNKRRRQNERFQDGTFRLSIIYFVERKILIFACFGSNDNPT